MTRSLHAPAAAVAALAAALLLAHAATRPIATAPAGRTVPAGGEAAAPAPYRVVMRLDGARSEDFAETVRRPLFWPERRPATAAPRVEAPAAPREPPATAATAPPPPAELKLAGIVGTSKGWRALIVSPAQPQGRWVGVGVELGGWRLERIDGRSVRLQAHGHTHELKLP